MNKKGAFTLLILFIILGGIVGGFFYADHIGLLYVPPKFEQTDQERLNVGFYNTEATARLDVMIRSENLFRHEIAKRVLEIAKEFPKTTSLDLKVYLDVSGITDKYGNRITEPIHMGTLKFSEADLTEARKYADPVYYMKSLSERLDREFAYFGGMYLLERQ